MTYEEALELKQKNINTKNDKGIIFNLCICPYMHEDIARFVAYFRGKHWQIKDDSAKLFSSNSEYDLVWISGNSADIYWDLFK